MPDTKPKEDRVLVAMQRDTAVIRVEGRGSFKVSTAVKEFGLAMSQRGCRAVVCDMADCVGMDSTFMGVLAGMASRLRGNLQGEVSLINLNPRTRALVGTLGLDQVVKAYETGQAPAALADTAGAVGRMETLSAGGEDRRVTTETMIEAHEHLVDISADNQPRFKDVLTFLREDLNKKSEGP